MWEHETERIAVCDSSTQQQLQRSIDNPHTIHTIHKPNRKKEMWRKTPQNLTQHHKTSQNH